MARGSYIGGSSVVGWGATSFVGRGSVTSQPGGSKRQKGKPAPRQSPIGATKLDKLARSNVEEVASAAKHIKAIRFEIARTERALAAARAQLNSREALLLHMLSTEYCVRTGKASSGATAQNKRK